jgi:hypothetical protein
VARKIGVLGHLLQLVLLTNIARLADSIGLGLTPIEELRLSENIRSPNGKPN